MKDQIKELKEANLKSKRAMDEVQQVNDKYSDMRSERNKLSRQLREREEDIDESKVQINQLKQDMRKADKSRKQVGYDWIGCF